MKVLIYVILFSTIVFFTSCEFHLGSGKIFEAKSDLKEGEEMIDKYHIKYISPSCYGVLYSDLYRKKGVFAYDIVEGVESTSYKTVDEKFVEEYHLNPKFTWWQKYGIFFSVITLIILGFFTFRFGIEWEFETE